MVTHRRVLLPLLVTLCAAGARGEETATTGEPLTLNVLAENLEEHLDWKTCYRELNLPDHLRHRHDSNANSSANSTDISTNKRPFVHRVGHDVNDVLT